MTSETFAIVFRGDIVIGQNLPDVKQRLQKLFNADSARIDTLFAGKPVPIKVGLSRQEAERYRILLQKTGAVVAIESQAPKTPKPDASPKAHTVPRSTEGDWKLAPVGSVLSDSKPPDNVVDVDTDHLQVMPQQGELLGSHERAPEPVSMIDVDSIDWQLSPYGERLLKEEEKQETPQVDVDVSGLSLAAQGGDLLKDSEKKQPVTTHVDTSHLRLQD